MSYIRYYLYKQQVSYDQGVHWYDTPVVITSGNPVGVFDTLADCERITPPSSGDYLTFIARGECKFKFRFSGDIGGDTLKYSLDNGGTWASLSSDVFAPTLQAGDKIKWKAEMTPRVGDSSYGIGTFYYSTGYFDIEGNPMSLLFGDNFDGQTNLFMPNAFKNLFASTSVVNSEHMVLPATKLSEGCYSGMFYGCEYLVTTPELPAIILAESCYRAMFGNCDSLTTAPALPAAKLAPHCYERMFVDCGSLIIPPSLLATTMEYECYRGMFWGCTSLTTAPELPATTLADSCYELMFQNCTSLTVAPDLPATTLEYECYYDMFKGCSNLTTAPKISATTLAESSCNEMFAGCTSLVVAPDLPATNLARFCYAEMFSGCTSLTVVPVLPARTLEYACYFDMFGDCTSLEEVPSDMLPATTLAYSCYSHMFIRCSSLLKAPDLPALTLYEDCYYRMFRDCSSLNYIKAFFTTNVNDPALPESPYLQEWTLRVSDSGTFVKNRNAFWTSDVVPDNWTVISTIP